MNKFSDYLETIVQINGLKKDLKRSQGSGVKVQWLFHSGMLFLSRDKWWGNFKHRSSEHEGIDICFYRSGHGKTQCFDDSIKVPAMDGGVIVNICNDFLGQTIVIQHQKDNGEKRQILFIYAHITPSQNIKPGQDIKKSSVIARVCNTHKNPQLPPHLHFSCIEVPCNINPEHLNWNLFSKSPDINLINPIFLK
jgi:hypothetical protein